MWQFDTNVASSFDSHARQHIPNYDTVIDKSLDVCELYGKSAKIIDVGCAIGETLIRLHNRGFTNLHGVDNSQSMLDKCPHLIASLTCSETLPEGLYDVIIINWTLHFIKDKKQYLQNVFDMLNPNGVVIISDKTSLDPLATGMYHDFKRSKGVSEEVIKQKQESIKNVMFIDDIEYYFSILKFTGFSKVHIIDSYWCFTTFVCIKS